MQRTEGRTSRFISGQLRGTGLSKDDIYPHLCAINQYTAPCSDFNAGFIRDQGSAKIFDVIREFSVYIYPDNRYDCGNPGRYRQCSTNIMSFHYIQGDKLNMAVFSGTL